ncbi:hypothetical protein M0R72_07745 [Candidatus Pacearchaeota archaeon]|nr:hypothetical protein [Candidatus Pacearchaeota archaeon]
MQTAHPDWEEYQLANLLYWQGTSKRMLRDEVARFKQSVPRVHVVPRNAHIDNYIDVTSTMAKVGIRLEWPARTKAYEIAFAGTSVVGLSEGEWVKLVGRWPELYAVREVDRPESQRGLLGLTFGKFVVEKYTPGIGWDVRCRCGITETITSRAILIKALGCCRCAQQKPPPRSGGNVC